MHHVDRDTPWDEIWQAFEQLVQQGKVLYIGSSNFAGWQLAHAQWLAAARHFVGLVSEQSLYNLAERTIELEVIPAACALGMGVIPWSAFGTRRVGWRHQRQRESNRVCVLFGISGGGFKRSWFFAPSLL
jgi:aryl-alcohol dehydrogenase-like predicted oxidoreductase